MNKSFNIDDKVINISDENITLEKTTEAFTLIISHVFPTVDVEDDFTKTSETIYAPYLRELGEFRAFMYLYSDMKFDDYTNEEIWQIARSIDIDDILEDLDTSIYSSVLQSSNEYIEWNKIKLANDNGAGELYKALLGMSNLSGTSNEELSSFIKSFNNMTDNLSEEKLLQALLAYRSEANQK